MIYYWSYLRRVAYWDGSFLLFFGSNSYDALKPGFGIQPCKEALGELSVKVRITPGLIPGEWGFLLVICLGTAKWLRKSHVSIDIDFLSETGIFLFIISKFSSKLRSNYFERELFQRENCFTSTRNRWSPFENRSLFFWSKPYH